MSDYQESSVVGTRWNRFNRIRIDNTLGAVPVVYLDEESVTVLADGRSLHEHVGTLQVPFVPEYPIERRNPGTGELTGQKIALSEVYEIVYSLCIQEALVRDGTIPNPGIIGEGD